MHTVSRSGTRRVVTPAAGNVLAATVLAALTAWPAAAGTLLVTDGSRVVSYNAQTGAPGGTLVAPGTGGLQVAEGLAWGPDGNLYVGDGGTGSILRFNGSTGAFISTFVTAGSGGLSQPESLVFGRQDNSPGSGKLYVASMATGSVLLYNGGSGAFLNALVPAGSGGLHNPWCLTGRDDNFAYVLDFGGNSVLRYDGQTGNFIGAFVAAGSGGLSGPKGFAFGPDGNLYIASSNTNQILRYNGTTGASMGVFATVASPVGLTFGPDSNLYVISSSSNSILSYNSNTGALINTFVGAGSGGLGSPTGLLFLPPKAPSALQANAVSFSQVNLSWTDNSDDETGYSIMRQGGNGGNWQFVGSVPPHSTSFSDMNLIPNTSYTYVVRAEGVVGASPWTGQAQVSTWPTAPMAPSNLTATVMSPFQINLNWTINVSNETAYSVWRKSPGSAWTRIATLPSRASSYNDNSVTPYTAYSYRVRAVNNFYPSDWSNEASGWTPLIPPPPPTDLAATAVSSTQINLTWSDDPTYAFALSVWRRSGASDWVRIAVLAKTATSYSDATASPNTTYSYKLRATNDDFASDWSKEVAVTTGP